MIKRGRILRDTNSGAGLISAEGMQYEFTLEKSWDSDLAPKVGMVVEIELDANGALSAAWAIDQKELAKEQAALMFNSIKEKSLVYYNSLAQLVGKPVLLATVILFAGWFNFSTININLGAFAGKEGLGFTFWQLLGLVNNIENIAVVMQGGIGGGRGIYGFLCIAALAGPFIFIFWKHPVAHLGNCLALLLILLVIGSSYMSYMDQISASQEALSKMGAGFGKDMMKGIADKALEQAMEMINIGLGTYLSLAASIFLAFIGVKKFLVASAESNLSPRSSASRVSASSGRRSSNSTLPTIKVETITPVSESGVNSVILRSCHACGALPDESASFCEECGTKLA